MQPPDSAPHSTPASCPLCASRWNPYIAGALIGALSMLAFAFADHPLGISTGVNQAGSALALPLLDPGVVQPGSYWQKVPARWDYHTVFLLGTLQLAASSWLFFVTMFVCGILTAMILFGLARFGAGGKGEPGS